MAHQGARRSTEASMALWSPRHYCAIFFYLHMYSRHISAFIEMLTESLLHLDDNLRVTFARMQVCRCAWDSGRRDRLWWRILFPLIDGGARRRNSDGARLSGCSSIYTTWRVLLEAIQRFVGLVDAVVCAVSGGANSTLNTLRCPPTRCSDSEFSNA